ncbi:MAG: hypothetical protein HGA93_04715 [Methanothrix sp.]|jgi:hypothetical protein|nr:hypothetical protein [Methanothrix sp.]
MSKEETMEEIAETLASINDSLEGINAELEDICMSSKMLIFFKMIELRPEMKEKLGPLIDDLAESMDLGMCEEPEKD